MPLIPSFAKVSFIMRCQLPLSLRPRFPSQRSTLKSPRGTRQPLPPQFALRYLPQEQPRMRPKVYDLTDLINLIPVRISQNLGFDQRMYAGYLRSPQSFNLPQYL